jgi:hypothetical protein
MNAPDTRSMSDDELAEVVEVGTLEEASRAATELARRRADQAGPGEDDDEPCDWRADRASDAWERSRDCVAERSR